MNPQDHVDQTVTGARFDAGRRELAIRFERTTIVYRKVTALGVTLGARLAAAEWIADALPQTLFTEYTSGQQGRGEGGATPLERASGRGLAWLAGGEVEFGRAPVRDGLAFTGGRWFRLFVGAASVETQVHGAT